MHILCCNCQYNSTSLPGKTALVRVTYSWHIDTDMRTRALERSLSGAENGPERAKNSDERNSRKNRAERGAGGTGAERWAGWICRSCAKACTICTLHFSEAKRGPGPGTSRLDFGGNPMTFFSLPHFHPDDQSWSLCVIHYTVSSTARLSLQSTLCLKKEDVSRLFLL